MSQAATHAVVSLPALDLRLGPDHKAELGSQLLLGEVVRLLGREQGGWQRVENAADGYRGWVKTWGLVPASAARVARWRSRARARVAAPLAQVFADRARAAAVSPLFFGCRLIAGPIRTGLRAVELPDGRRGFVAAAALALGERPTLSAFERIQSLLGSPYLWGGRTPAGYDCSGFVQQVLHEQGIALPRDARAQQRLAKRGEIGVEASAGDLVFFGRAGEPVSHVGLALGEGYFAHSRGWVRISSLDPVNPLCDKDLLPQYRGFGRILKGAARRAIPGSARPESA